MDTILNEYEVCYSNLRGKPPSEVFSIMNDKKTRTVERIAAIKMIANLDISDMEKVEKLIPLLRNEKNNITSWALIVLGEIGIQESIPRIRLMAQHVPPQIEPRFLLTLGMLGDESIIRDCERHLSSEENDEFIYAVVMALAELGTPKALETLTDRFQSETNLERKKTLGIHLARKGVPSVEEFLCDQLMHGNLNEINRVIITAVLCKLGNRMALNALADIVVKWKEHELFKISYVLWKFVGVLFKADAKNLKADILEWVGTN